MRLASKSLGGAEELPSWDREVLVGSPRVDIVCAPHVDHQPSIVGAVRLLSAAQLCGAAAFTRRPRLLDQLLDAGTLIFRKTLHGQASSLRAARKTPAGIICHVGAPARARRPRPSVSSRSRSMGRSSARTGWGPGDASPARRRPYR